MQTFRFDFGKGLNGGSWLTSSIVTILECQGSRILVTLYAMGMSMLQMLEIATSKDEKKPLSGLTPQ